MSDSDLEIVQNNDHLQSSDQPSPISLSAPQQHPLSQQHQASTDVCLALVDELRTDYKLRVFDKCPSCHKLVSSHSRSSIYSSPLLNPQSSPALASTVRRGSELNEPASSMFTSMIRPTYQSIIRAIKSSIPQWSRSKTCHQFLSELERVLKTTELPTTEWYRAFAFVTNESITAEWIDRNIIEPKLEFSLCKASFTNHFELSSADAIMRLDFSRCHQLKIENVQNYADRFMHLCTQLQIEDSNQLALDHFVQNLTSHLAKQYIRQYQLVRLSNPLFAITTITQAIQFAISLQAAEQTAQLYGQPRHPEQLVDRDQQPHRGRGGRINRGSRPNESNNESEVIREIICYNCGIHGHKKPDCPALIKPSGPAGHTSAPTPTCYKCGRSGHYSNNCTTYSTSGPTNMAPRSTTVQPSQNWSSKQSTIPIIKPISSSTNQNQSTTSQYSNEPRRSQRPKQAPSRFTPVITAKTTDVTNEMDQYDDHATINCNDIELNEPESPTCSAVQVSTSTALVNNHRMIKFHRNDLYVQPYILNQRGEIVLSIKNHIYRALIDTGASHSFIDPKLVDKFELSVDSQDGKIQLAQQGHYVKRLGTLSQPLHFTAYFLSSSHELEPVVAEHSFELMPLPIDQPFILGVDLLPSLFYRGFIPMDFITSLPITTQVNTVTVNKSTLITDIIESTNPEQLSSLPESDGLGYIPEPESSDRAQVVVDSKLRARYDRERDHMSQDVELQQSLHHNAQITGFCTLPESVLHLAINPELAHTIYRRQYPVSESVKPFVTEIINRWFNTGRIELAPVGCRFNSALTMAPKRDNTGTITGIRVCLDTRALNLALTVYDKFQLPYIKTALESLAGSSIFGEFDLAEAYLQFEVAPDSRVYTAFTWEGTQYVFVGCPFGISILPSHFQRVMSIIFRGLSFTFPYLDNLPFASNSWEEHRQHALIIIQRLSQFNLHIKPSSIKLGYSELRCLGHVISINGISINPDKCRMINDWPLPQTGKQLMSFLGFVNFIRHHIRHIADLTGPLEAIKFRQTIEWTPVLIEHFELTKAAVQRAPILQFPKYDKQFVIATDASNTGIGGVLYQPTDSNYTMTSTNIVAILSYKLTQCQLNYPVYKKELFAIVHALRKFHQYVWGTSDLIIITDHKPLIHILQSEKLSPSVQQWLDVLLDYKFHIIHRPGITNIIPDHLSRLYTELYPGTWGIASHQHITNTVQHFIGDECPSDALTNSYISCSAINQINNDSTNLQIQLELRGKIAPPESERETIIQLEHDKGHFGREAIFKQLWHNNYWWPGMRKDIQDVVNNCDACLRFSVGKAGFHPSSFIISNGPWDHIQIDTSVHLPPSTNKHVALLVIIDVFTGFVILKPLKSTTSLQIARKLYKVFSLMGIPKILQSDNGPEFIADILKQLISLFKINHRFISPYNPRCDGKVERAIGTAVGIIKKLLQGTERHWPEFVPFAQLMFNYKISSLTESSPFSLMFTRQLNNQPSSNNDHEQLQFMTTDEWTSLQQRVLGIIYPTISDRVQILKEKMIKSIDKSRRVIKQSLPKGSVVMLIDPIRSDKFEPKYIGPYTIIRRARHGAYVLRDVTGDILDRHVPLDQMKIIKRSINSKSKSTESFEVDHIVSHRGEPGHYEYLVRWKNYTSDDDTWEPELNFHDVQCIRNYWKSHQPSNSLNPTSF
jgi:hypothetical protein